MNIRTYFISKNISKEQIKDTGMAIVLILLLSGYFTDNHLYYKISLIFLLLNMVIPKIYYYPAILWFGLSHILGNIMTKIILSLLFILLIIPMGFFRKAIGKDPMQIKKWKKGEDSVMKIRNKTFISSDIEKPY